MIPTHKHKHKYKHKHKHVHKHIILCRYNHQTAAFTEIDPPITHQLLGTHVIAMDTPVGVYVRLPVSYWEREEDRQLKTAMEIAEVSREGIEGGNNCGGK